MIDVVGWASVRHSDKHGDPLASEIKAELRLWTLLHGA